MSYRTKAEAKAAAEGKVRPLLPGDPKKWKLEIHENLGWHWTFHLGPISLHKGFGMRYAYHAMIASDVDETSHGRGVWTKKGTSASTPKKAVQNALAAYGEFATSERALLNRMDAFFLKTLGRELTHITIPTTPTKSMLAGMRAATFMTNGSDIEMHRRFNGLLDRVLKEKPKK